MAKQFFYVSMGILALVVAYHLGAVKAAKAEWTGSGCVVGMACPYFYAPTGEAYIFSESSEAWERRDEVDLPVPIADVAMLDDYSTNKYLVTVSGEVWRWIPSGPWEQLPQLPSCIPSKTEQTSWGGLKDMFR